jgi:hypothetical protein
MLKEIEAEAALEKCRALIDQINAGLSEEEPFVDVLSSTELLLYLDFAASALKKAALSSREHEETKIEPNYHWQCGICEPTPREQLCSRPTVGLSARGHRQRARGRRKSLPATACQRSSRTFSYGFRFQFGVQGRDTYSVRLPQPPFRPHLGMVCRPRRQGDGIRYRCAAPGNGDGARSGGHSKMGVALFFSTHT